MSDSDHPTGVIDAGELRLVHLADDPMLVALPRTHRLAATPSLRLADLADESRIVTDNRGNRPGSDTLGAWRWRGATACCAVLPAPGCR